MSMAAVRTYGNLIRQNERYKVLKAELDRQRLDNLVWSYKDDYYHKLITAVLHMYLCT